MANNLDAGEKKDSLIFSGTITGSREFKSDENMDKNRCFLWICGDGHGKGILDREMLLG